MTYAQARTELLARGEPYGPGRRAALTDAADSWLAELLTGATGGDDSGVALVAVGGYGRREMVAGSDLDVLLLHSRKRGMNEVANKIWYPIWDDGIKLDHSVRTVGEARSVAAEDLKALLGMLDMRHVAGDVGLTEQLRSTVLADWRSAATNRLPELHASAVERDRGNGELAFLLEPDLKESRGALRDLVTLRAVQASWVADVPHARIALAHDRLLDVRDALHTVTGRSTDRLVLQEQENVASALGLLDAVALMRSLAEVGRNIAYASDITWRRVEQVLETRTRRFRIRGTAGKPLPRTPLADGVVQSEGEAVLARDADPARDPILVLRAAAAAAQAGIPLSPGTVDRFAATTKRLPEPWPDAAREQLVRLLGAGRPAVAVWEALDLAGVITTLLPDWARVSCRPQRNAVHRFTVDRHLVEAAANAAALTRRVARPDLLLVGCLLHDIGKGWPGNHSVVGATIVRDLAPRLGFSEPDTDVLVMLVTHHLLLPDTATRRDLDDPRTLEVVAEAVGTVENLDLLAALTEADALATGAAAWTPWRAELIASLVEKTRAVLSGKPVPVSPGLSEAQRALAREGVIDVHIGGPEAGCAGGGHDRHRRLPGPDRAAGHRRRRVRRAPPGRAFRRHRDHRHRCCDGLDRAPGLRLATGRRRAARRHRPRAGRLARHHRAPGPPGGLAGSSSGHRGTAGQRRRRPGCLGRGHGHRDPRPRPPGPAAPGRAGAGRGGGGHPLGEGDHLGRRGGRRLLRRGHGHRRTAGRCPRRSRAQVGPRRARLIPRDVVLYGWVSPRRRGDMHPPGLTQKRGVLQDVG